MKRRCELKKKYLSTAALACVSEVVCAFDVLRVACCVLRLACAGSVRALEGGECGCACVCCACAIPYRRRWNLLNWIDGHKCSLKSTSTKQGKKVRHTLCLGIAGTDVSAEVLINKRD